jgi:hypothetical protein
MEGTQVHVDCGIDASISLSSGANSPHDLAHSPGWRRLRFEYSLRDAPYLSSVSRGRPVSICIRTVYYCPRYDRPPHPTPFRGAVIGVSGISGEFSGRLVTKAPESFGAGSSSVEGDLELSVLVCSASTLRPSRGLSERC